MTREEAIEKLKAILTDDELSEEQGHIQADKVLLDLIGDNEITQGFTSIRKWYA